MNRVIFVIKTAILAHVLTICVFAQGQPAAGAAAAIGIRGAAGTATVSTQRPDRVSRLVTITEIEKQIAALKTAIQKSPATDPCIAQLQGEALSTFTNQYNDENNAINQIVTALNSLRPSAAGGRGSRGGISIGSGITTDRIAELKKLAQDEKATKLIERLDALTKEAQDAAARGGRGNTANIVQPDAFQARTFSNVKYEHSLPYRLFIPTGYSSSKSYPLVLFLHGAGERGTNNTSQLTANRGATVWAEPSNQSVNPCFVLAPQCPSDEKWTEHPGQGSYSFDNVKPEDYDELPMVMDIISDLKKEFNIDVSRIYITGLSMGGYGTWFMICKYPNVFAAALPCCGAGDPSKASVIAHIPIWTFHGDQDTTVPVSASREMIVAVKNAGGSPKYTEYPGVGHNSWVNAYSEKELISWTFAQKLQEK
jgi:predicted peptidase